MQIGASQVWLSLCKGLSKSGRESFVVRVPLAGWLVKVNSLQVLFNSSSPLDQYCNPHTQNTMDTLWLEIQSTSMRSLLRGWKVIQPRTKYTTSVWGASLDSWPRLLLFKFPRNMIFLSGVCLGWLRLSYFRIDDRTFLEKQILTVLSVFWSYQVISH